MNDINKKMIKFKHLTSLNEAVDIDNNFQIVKVDPNHDRDTYENVMKILTTADPLTLSRFGPVSPINEMTADYRLLAFHNSNPISLFQAFFYKDNEEPINSRYSKYAWIEALTLGDYQGKGLMPKLVSLGLKDLSENYNIHSFLWACYTDNHHSRSIPMKFGFEFKTLTTSGTGKESEVWIKKV